MVKRTVSQSCVEPLSVVIFLPSLLVSHVPLWYWGMLLRRTPVPFRDRQRHAVWRAKGFRQGRPFVFSPAEKPTMSGDFEIGPSADRINDVFEEKSLSEGKPFSKRRSLLWHCLHCIQETAGSKKRDHRCRAITSFSFAVPSLRKKRTQVIDLRSETSNRYDSPPDRELAKRQLGRSIHFFFDPRLRFFHDHPEIEERVYVDFLGLGRHQIARQHHDDNEFEGNR